MGGSGLDGQDQDQGVWLAGERRKPITWRELIAFNMLLRRKFGALVE